MSLKDKKIDICIATFKRPSLLYKLLDSILNQKFLPAKNNLRIIIIDNDKHATAKKIVDRFRNQFDFKFIYDIEPVPNIANTRNKALNNVIGDYVVFVDDDEYVSENWLYNLIQCSVSHNADVVFGPVVSILPDTVENWVIKGKFFTRSRFVTGCIMDRGGTGNVLVKASIFLNLKSHFKPEYGRTGGSDTEFFYKLKKNGYKMIWCDEAEVFESVLPQRLNIKWLVMRFFRGGQTFMRIYFFDMKLIKKISWCTFRCLLIIFYIIALPLMWFSGKHNGVKALQKIATYFGQFSILLSRRYYKEYDNG